MKHYFLMMMSFMFMSCTSIKPNFFQEKIELNRFMGDWYVHAGRFTFLETGVHNAIESYKYDEKSKTIEISFFYNKNSFDGKLISIPQKGWVHNFSTNTHWKVSPLWPLKFDYLILYVDPDYRFTAIGVPDQKYLWIMSREKSLSEKDLLSVTDYLKSINYDVSNLTKVPHKL